MVDLFAIIITCTPPPPLSLHHLFSGTLEYCTVCSANSLVVGPGSGMIGLYLLLFCFVAYRSYQTFCLTQSFMPLLITLGALTSRLETG